MYSETHQKHLNAHQSFIWKSYSPPPEDHPYIFRLPLTEKEAPYAKAVGLEVWQTLDPPSYWVEVTVYAHNKEVAFEAAKAFQKGEDLPPNMTVNAKLLTWGCPACGSKGTFIMIPIQDAFECQACVTRFSHQWALKWNGQTDQNLKGLSHVGYNPPPSNHPAWWGLDDEDQQEELTYRQKMEGLFEKVVAFREAVVNPDRVLEDEQIETLMREMFDLSYTIFVPGVETKLGLNEDNVEDVDLSPDTYESATAYAAALMAAVAEDVITQQQADDLFKAFGGPDPFPDDPGDSFAFPA
jgi:hypothetical protein